LSHGLIGAENSYLLGTFIVSKLQQIAMARQAIAEEQRTPFYLYTDEFQHFVTPSMSAILDGTRKYSLGLILSHQSMQQVTDAELAASMSNAGTRICFRVSETDAKKLEAGFSYFEAKDLQNLSVGEAIVRIERPEHDFSLTTALTNAPLQPANTKEQIIAHSRSQYSTPRQEVEAMIAESMQLPIEEPKVEKPNPQRNAMQTMTQKERIPVPEQEIASHTADQKTKPMTYETKDITHTPEAHALIKREEQRMHTSLKNRIKRIAEGYGYKATLEHPTPDRKGFVDVLLEKNGNTIACEVSVTTGTTWELHNIAKCLAAGYGTVVVCSTDKKTIAGLRTAVLQAIPESDRARVFVFDPDELIFYFRELAAKEASYETTIKGYRVKVEYKAVSPEVAKMKRQTIAKILFDSVLRQKKEDNDKSK
jgi:hypothetical protein